MQYKDILPWTKCINEKGDYTEKSICNWKFKAEVMIWLIDLVAYSQLKKEFQTYSVGEKLTHQIHFRGSFNKLGDKWL